MAVDLGPYSNNEGTPHSKEDLPPQPSLPCVLANPHLKDEDVQNKVNEKRDLRALQSTHTDDPCGFCRYCRTLDAYRHCIAHAGLLDVGAAVAFLRKRIRGFLSGTVSLCSAARTILDPPRDENIREVANRRENRKPK